jgi:hypothetical protein
MKKELTPEEKEAKRLYQREYYLMNKSKKEKYYNDNKKTILLQKKEYREENKENINKKRKQYREQNKEKIKLSNKDWSDNNKEYRQKYDKKYREQNKQKINERVKEYRKNNEKYLEKRRSYENNKYKTNNFFKLKRVYSNLVRNSFKRKNINKTLKSSLILGCTIIEFKLHLESKFESWMSWDNHGLYNGELNYGWDIDHIQPLCIKINRDIKKHNLI